MKIFFVGLKDFFKKQIVFVVAILLAVISTIIFKPSGKEILGAIDFRSLSILFSLMAMVQAFSLNGAFTFLSLKIISGVKKSWLLIFALVCICFFFSMFITNDVALITFVPLTISLLQSAGLSSLILITIVLQTLAANLGSMLTPVGNPQNLYLFNLMKCDVWSFIKIMLPYSCASFLLLIICIFFVKGFLERRKCGALTGEVAVSGRGGALTGEVVVSGRGGALTKEALLSKTGSGLTKEALLSKTGSALTGEALLSKTGVALTGEAQLSKTGSGLTKEALLSKTGSGLTKEALLSKTGSGLTGEAQLSKTGSALTGEALLSKTGSALTGEAQLSKTGSALTGEALFSKTAPASPKETPLSKTTVLSPKETTQSQTAAPFLKVKLILFSLLALISLLTVFNFIPYYVTLPLVLICIFFAERRALKKVDYILLLTFVGFFIFTGNLSHSQKISFLISSVLQKREILCGIISSQVISNVPAAILLSGFTENLKELTVGVNLGGLGTLIASMASLISFKFYAGLENSNGAKYILIFSILNILFLGILYGMTFFFF